ncbi:hypothetical protein SDC9_37777 [bioreactor metagenome]|uniref:HK97 gp10 family phage protein n=1 Tax=bioreactor metagenome TaxID=1076179 RepID=A0A644VK62_9ZZZZ
MSNTIVIDALANEIESLLNSYNNEIITGVKKETKIAMKELVKGTKADAPVGNRRNKHYKDSITSKKVAENNDRLIMKWYVKGSEYRLSHLLNDGHATRNGGRVEGVKFISNNVNKIERLYITALKGVILKSG